MTQIGGQQLLLYPAMARNSLVSMPPEVLGQILSYDCVSHKAIDLWKCGSRVLQSTLTRAVMRVKLWNTKRYIHLDLPNVLGKFTQLRSLVIDRLAGNIWKRPHALYRTSNTLRVLRSLNPNLEELVLLFAGSSSFCLPSFDLFPTSLFDAPSDSPPLEDENQYPISINLAATFPKLQTLAFDTRSKLSSKDLRCLPQSLNSLVFHLDEHDSAKNIASALPRSLTYLQPHFDDSDTDSSFCGALPPSLTDVDYSWANTENADAIKKTFTATPQLRSMELDTLDFVMNLEDLSKVAPTVTSLIARQPIGVDQESWVRALPPSLTELKGQGWEGFEFSSKNLRFFPQSMTRLESDVNLAELKAGECPASILSIRGSSDSEETIPAEFVSYLSPSLVSLRISANSAPIAGSFFYALPNSVRTLKLMCQRFDEIPTLPPHLEYLKLVSEEPSEGQICRLPERLTHLTWAIAGTDYRSLSLLPPRLKSLKLQVLKNPEQFNPEDPSVLAQAQLLREIGQKEGFLHLSENLALDASSITLLDLMPRTLTYLQFGRYMSVSRIPSSSWGHIPKYLEILEILGDKLSSEALIAVFPLDRLNRLDLGPCTFTEAIIKALPKGLLDINLDSETDFSQIRSDVMAKYAPAEIRSLDWNGPLEKAAKMRQLALTKALSDPNPSILEALLNPKDD